MIFAVTLFLVIGEGLSVELVRPRDFGAVEVAISAHGSQSPIMFNPDGSNSTGSLKIYVYDLPSYYNYDLLHLQTWHEESYDADVHLHRKLLTHASRTEDPHEAELFFVPVYGTRFLHKALFGNGGDNKGNWDAAYEATNDFYLSVLNELSHWDKGAANHVFAMTHDLGRRLWGEKCKEFQQSISLQHDGVNSWGEHDVIIPPFVKTPQEPWSNDRGTFALFRGSIDDPRYTVRNRLFQLYQNSSDVIITGADTEDWEEEMQQTKFCLVPSGIAEWSFRYYEVALRGCIPVMMNSVYNAMPFERQLDYTSFALRYQADGEEIKNLSRSLRQVNESEFRQKLSEANEFYDWNQTKLVDAITNELAANRPAKFSS